MLTKRNLLPGGSGLPPPPTTPAAGSTNSPNRPAQPGQHQRAVSTALTTPLPKPRHQPGHPRHGRKSTFACALRRQPTTSAATLPPPAASRLAPTPPPTPIIPITSALPNCRCLDATAPAWPLLRSLRPRFALPPIHKPPQLRPRPHLDPVSRLPTGPLQSRAAGELGRYCRAFDTAPI